MVFFYHILYVTSIVKISYLHAIIHFRASQVRPDIFVGVWVAFVGKYEIQQSHYIPELQALDDCNQQRQRQIETGSHNYCRGQNWIKRQFRGETKPLKHLLKPSEQPNQPFSK